MSGARKLAVDYVSRFVLPGQSILDVACGDGWLRPIAQAAGASWTGLDISPRSDSVSHCDLANAAELPRVTSVDLAVSSWGIQHLCDDEAHAWMTLRRYLNPGGRFVYVGRYGLAPKRENDRADPLNGYCRTAFEGLALATGFEVLELERFFYDRDHYRIATDETPNAFGAVLRRRGDA